MSGNFRTYTLPEMLVKKLGFSWSLMMPIVAVILILPLFLIALTDDVSQRLLNWDYWRLCLPAPAIIIYILAIYPYLTKLGNNAVESARPLLNSNDNVGETLISYYSVPSRRGEWVSISVGVVFILLLSQPWRMEFTWFDIYLEITSLLMFGLLALLIYYGIRNTRFLTKLHRNLKLDIFNIQALVPIARWSLSETFAFIGGIIISIVFQTINNLMRWQTISIYGILIGATVFIFFMSIWSTHRTIVRVKNNELTFVAKKLREASRKLKQQATDETREISGNLYYEVAAWGLYEKHIRDVGEWPFNAGIIARLVFSIISPAVIYMIKGLSGMRLGF